jgi:WD40 repeat protein
MADAAQLERWRQALRAKTLLIGGLRRQAALWAMHRNRETPVVTRFLVEVARSPAGSDAEIAPRVQKALEDLHAQPAIDALCAAWVDGYDPRLGEIIAKRRYQAKRPARVRVLSALKWGGPVFPERGGAASVREIMAALNCPDAEVRANAQAALKELKPGEGLDALCSAWADSRDSRLEAILSERGHVAGGSARSQVLLALKAGTLAIAERGGAATVREVVAAMDDPDAAVRAGAEAALRALKPGGGLDALCSTWAEGRNDRLGEIIAGQKYVAARPQSLRILTALKTGTLDKLDRGDATVVRETVAAMDDPDATLRANAEAVLRGLGSGEGVDTLCSAWAESRNSRLRAIIVQGRHVPSGPLPVRILCQLISGHPPAVEAVETAQVLVDLLKDSDREIAGTANGILRALPPGRGRDALCELALREPSGTAADVCRECAYRPADTVRESLFLLVTRQLDAYLDQDNEFHNLHLAYEQSDAQIRANVMEVLRSGERRLVGFFGGSKSLKECSEAEIRSACASWTGSGAWEKVLGACLELPLRYGLSLWANLGAHGWEPEDRELRQLCRQVATEMQMLHMTIAECAPGEDRETLLERQLGKGWLIPPQSGQPLTPPMEHHGPVLRVGFSPEGTRVATGSDDHTAMLWDAATGQPMTPPMEHNGAVLDVRFSGDGTKLVTASADHTAVLWETTTGRPLTSPMRHDGEVLHVEFSPDGTKIVTAGEDHAAVLWDVATGRSIGSPIRHAGPVTHAGFSPDGARIVTACKDRGARVWDAATGKPLTPAMRHRGAVNGAAFSPDGTRIITASSDKTARVWDVATGKPLTPAMRHQGSVSGATFSPDGTRIITASADKTARVWDAATGKPLTPPLRHDGAVTHAAFSPDGTKTVTSSSDGTARLLDADTGKPLIPQIKQRSSVLHVTFSPDGMRIATGIRGGSARVWNAWAWNPLDLWPGKASPVEMDLLTAAIAKAQTPALAAALRVLRYVLVYRLASSGTFETVLVDPDAYAGEFERAQE